MAAPIELGETVAEPAAGEPVVESAAAAGLGQWHVFACTRCKATNQGNSTAKVGQ